MFDKLVDLLVSWIKLFFFAFTLKDYERGVIFRVGRFHRDVGPGLHFHWPFDIEEVYYLPIVPATVVIGPQSLTTKDDITVVVSVLVTYSIEDVRKALTSMIGVHSILEGAAVGVVSDFVTRHTWAEIRSVQSADEKEIDIDHEIAKASRRRARRYGVMIDRVQFYDLTKSRSLRLIGIQHVTADHV